MTRSAMNVAAKQKPAKGQDVSSGESLFDRELVDWWCTTPLMKRFAMSALCLLREAA